MMNPNTTFHARQHVHPRSASAPAATSEEDSLRNVASVAFVTSDHAKDHPIVTAPPTRPFNLKRTVWNCVTRRIPIVQRCADRFQRIPPRYRYGCFLCWLLYKVATAVLLLVVLHHQVTQQLPTESNAKVVPPNGKNTASKRTLSAQSGTAPPIKILYIVTSLSEYNTGRRSTVAGQDRLGEVVLPILVDSVESMVLDPRLQYQVDVFLILAYTLRPERERIIREQLPPRVGLQIWDDACPLGYDVAKSSDHLANNTRALARQHRYVIKDKLPYYDLFIAFEDDMRITGAHVQHFLALSGELDMLRQQARTSTGKIEAATMKDAFFGALTLRQLDRLIPGFVRVEVLLNEAEHGAQQELDPIPLDYESEGREVHFNPQPCCHVQMNPNVGTPVHPEAKDVIVWETNIQALSVRQLPKAKRQSLPKESTQETRLDWVALLPGPGKRLQPDDVMTSFWSGKISQNGVWKEKPSAGQPDLIAQQGGWMATKEQILRLNHLTKDKGYPQLCQGSFLPPFDEPIYRKDGQESMNVEFWSGGYQLFTGVKGGCNMMRIVSMHPDHFSKHFIYHVANNKQKQLAQNRMVRVDHLWAQLNSVRKAAYQEQQALLLRNATSA